jgi:thiamine pyrophosphate-dependent acetolactate synthase large subunit-like protein
MSRTGAERLVEALAAHGVKHLFTLSGNQILSVYDATVGRDLTLVHTRHEAAAVHMADAWGRLTDEPGVALVTAGPGHCNAISALYGALMSESPVVLLSGHAPRGQLGTGAFQEMDQVGTARPVTKAAWLAESADTLGDDIDRAFASAASGRPGPVHVSLPGDVLEAGVTSGSRTPARDASTARAAQPTSAPPAESRATLALLAGAKRPLIVAGPAMGRGRRWRAISTLAELTHVPALVMESPRGVNDPALRAAGACLARADLVVLAGKKLDYTLRFGRPPAFAADARFVHLDFDGGFDPLAGLEEITRLARAQSWRRTDWSEEVAAAHVAFPAGWSELRSSTRAPIHPVRLCAALQPHLDSGGILVSDGGEFGQWAQAELVAHTRLINGPSGSIGSALPMALAAKLAHPDRAVIATLGDGTFGYHALEFDTALRYGLPIVAVVGNDARWNAEYQLQIQHYGRDRTVGCELLPSRYDRIVEAIGGHGEHVERPEDLTPAITRAIGSGRPACVNVTIEGVAAPTF